jgi:pyruvate carboxylase subunit B
MLLRGQNIVQYASFPDDVVEAFVRCMCQSGMDIIRIFDALNDVRNLKTAIQAVKKYKKHARGELCYTISPVHTVANFVKMGVELEKMGCDSLGIKDMSGILQPRITFDLVKELKSKVGIPITLHTHDTAGLGAASYLAAIDAGVDCVEVSIRPSPTALRNRTRSGCWRCSKAILAARNSTPKNLRNCVIILKAFTRSLAKFTSPANERVDSDILIYQVPGGMLSNFRTQLKEQGMSDRFDEVVREIPVVREALGWIPLVTPTSQIVGTQAMMNVKFGRWKMICQPAQDIALGKYGKTPGPDQSQCPGAGRKLSGKKPDHRPPADLLEPGLEKYRKQCAEKGLPTDDEIVVLYAMFPQQVEALLKPKPAAAPAPAAVPVSPSGTPPTNGKGKHLFVTLNGQTARCACRNFGGLNRGNSRESHQNRTDDKPAPGGFPAGQL